METTLIILVVAAGAAALFGWTSRNKLARDLDASRQEAAKLRSEASSARKAAERTSEDKKGRSDELAATREKLREVKKRLHESGQELQRERQAVSARDEERRMLLEQVDSIREENAQLSMELRRRREFEEERARGRKVEAPAAERPAPAPVALAPAQIDARLEVMGKKVEEAERKAQEAERKAQEARRQADESREELKRSRGRAEANNRVYLVTKGELDLWKAKFAALEQRWNELWRELEGIDWKPRTPKEPVERTEAPSGDGKRRGPRREKTGSGRGAPRAKADVESLHAEPDVSSEDDAKSADAGGTPAASARAAEVAESGDGATVESIGQDRAEETVAEDEAPRMALAAGAEDAPSQDKGA